MERHVPTFPSDRDLEHLDALVRAFVLPRYRDRLLIKPRQLLSEMCHRLPGKLDPKYIVRLHLNGPPVDAATSLLVRLTRRTTAWYLGGWSELPTGEYPLTTALTMVEETGGAAASIEPGELVYYKTESASGADRFLLVSDAERLGLATQLVARLAHGRERK